MSRVRFFCAVVGVLSLLSCALASAQNPQKKEPDWKALRQQLVEQDLVPAGIQHAATLQAIRTVPRHEFIPAIARSNAYFDMTISIGQGQTISAPYMVAKMTQLLDPQPQDRVLEIGTGSGYQAAVLAAIVKEVNTIEIEPTLAQTAAATFQRLGIANVHAKCGDGYLGWPEQAPFQKVIVTCSPHDVPAPLVEQLAEGGKLVVPLGDQYQQILYLFTKTQGKLVLSSQEPTYFVPMTGLAQQGKASDNALPQLRNGSLEEAARIPGLPDNWFYQRQVTLETGTGHNGTAGWHFSNRTLGRVSQGLQALPVDGRQTRLLKASAWFRGQKIKNAPDKQLTARLLVTFFDQQNLPAGQGWLNVPSGSTFDWQQVTGELIVPQHARSAIVAVGLLGATGDLWVDDLDVSAAEAPATPLARHPVRK